MKTFLAVDVQSLFYYLKRQKKRLNYQRVLDLFADKDLVAKNAYLTTSPHTETSYLIKTLESMGYDVRSQKQEKERRQLKFNSRSVGITIDCMDHLHEYDEVVLISVDENLTSLVDYLISQNKKVIVWTLDRTTIQNLPADEVHILDASFYLQRAKTEN